MTAIERDGFFTNRISRIVARILTHQPSNAINAYENKIAMMGPEIRELNNSIEPFLPDLLKEIAHHGLTGEEALEALLDAKNAGVLEDTVKVLKIIIDENLFVSIDALYGILDISRSMSLSWAINLNAELRPDVVEEPVKKKPFVLPSVNDFA